MRIETLLLELLQATLLSSAATLLALALRRPMQRLFSAQHAYALWALVPVVVLASLLPAPLPTPSLSESMAVIALPMQQATQWAAAPELSAWPFAVAALWVLGGVILLVHMHRKQRGFMRQIGRLQVTQEGHYAEHDAPGLPATVGVLRPKIVLPRAFATRFSAQQRQLMLLHERTHIARGDHWMNAVALLLQCLFWFNPLMHMARARFRQDQELACDACVMAQCPTVRRAYGEALLHTQLTAQATPLGCHFGFSHPLKERLQMLNRTQSSLVRRVTGSVAVMLLSGGVALSVWASQAPPQAKTLQPSTVIDRTPAPNYPAEAMQEGKQGTVVLIVDVDATGKAVSSTVERSSGDARLDASAQAAAMQWKFRPEVKNGKPVAGRVKVPVEFALEMPADKTS